MDFLQEERFYMVANAEARPGFPIEFLIHPPRGIHSFEKDAEAEALRLAKKTGQTFVILEAKALICLEDGRPVWREM